MLAGDSGSTGGAVISHGNRQVARNQLSNMTSNTNSAYNSNRGAVHNKKPNQINKHVIQKGIIK